MHKLIINADDFGMSKEVNEGIKKGIKAHVINSVSVMVNMPYFEDAVTFLKKHPEVSVGLHFNITEGLSLSAPNKVGLLLREDNIFFHWIFLVFKLASNKFVSEQISEELHNQYKKLKATGLDVSNIDSHHHVHLFPNLFRVVTKFAQKKGIKTLRCRRFHLWDLTNGIKQWPTLKQTSIMTFSFLNNLLNSQSKDLFTADNIYDLNWNKNLTAKKFINILKNLPSGRTEIICHPGIISKFGNYEFLAPRQKDLDLLLNPSIKKYILYLYKKYS